MEIGLVTRGHDRVMTNGPVVTSIMTAVTFTHPTQHAVTQDHDLVMIRLRAMTPSHDPLGP
jgi:hypothetical protein